VVAIQLYGSLNIEMVNINILKIGNGSIAVDNIQPQRVVRGCTIRSTYYWFAADLHFEKS
jgi:hypothetical protein